jgi:iron(III) transport system substrate-binding protein
MRWLTLVPVLLLFAVSACGGAAPASSSGSAAVPSVPPSAGAAGATPAASASPKPAAGSASPAASSSVSGDLAWYTLFASNSTAPIIQKFNQRYPNVKVAATQFGSAEMLERIRAEYKSGVNNFDVMDVVFGFYADQLTDEGILAEYRSPEAKNYPAASSVEGPKGTYDFFARSPNGLCTNKDSSPQPAAWDDLLKPDFKGKIVMQTPLTVSGPRSWLVDSRDYWGDEKWQAFWHGLGQQNVVFTATPTDALQMVVRGEKAVMIHCPATLGYAQFSKGAPIKWLAEDPITVSDIAIATASKAKNAKAAQAFVDFMLSKDGQQSVADNLVLLAILPGIKQNEFFTGVDKVKQISSPTKFQTAELAKDQNLTFYQDFAKKELNVR